MGATFACFSRLGLFAAFLVAEKNLHESRKRQCSSLEMNLKTFGWGYEVRGQNERS